MLLSLLRYTNKWIIRVWIIEENSWLASALFRNYSIIKTIWHLYCTQFCSVLYKKYTYACTNVCWTHFVCHIHTIIKTKKFSQVFLKISSKSVLFVVIFLTGHKKLKSVVKMIFFRCFSFSLYNLKKEIGNHNQISFACFLNWLFNFTCWMLLLFMTTNYSYNNKQLFALEVIKK